MKISRYLIYVCVAILELLIWCVIYAVAVSGMLGSVKSVLALGILGIVLMRFNQSMAYLRGVYLFQNVSAGVVKLLSELDSPKRSVRIRACVVLSAIAGERFGSPYIIHCAGRWRQWLADNANDLIWDEQLGCLTERRMAVHCGP